MTKEISIIIPVYKETPNHFELISLKQCLKILNRYTVTFVVPESLNTSYYVTLADQNSVKFKIEIFDDCFFSSIKGYNKLMLSQSFYSRFMQYQYILIYQLDCFVFRDELEYWSTLGYDYIGAPWFEHYDKQHTNEKLWYVGNGGFSLRKTSAFLEILSQKKIRLSMILLFKFYFKNLPFSKKITRFPLLMLCFLGYKNNKKYYLDAPFNEDVFWSYFTANIKTPIKIIPLEDSIKFSFDGNPSFLMKINNYQLPFGCHAWYKYGEINLKFWKPFILYYGYDL